MNEAETHAEYIAPALDKSRYFFFTGTLLACEKASSAVTPSIKSAMMSSRLDDMVELKRCSFR